MANSTIGSTTSSPPGYIGGVISDGGLGYGFTSQGGGTLVLQAANTFSGVNKFQQLQISISTVATLPPCNASFEGQMEGVSDAVSPSYLATVTGGGSVHVPVYCNGTSWVAH